MRSRPSPAPTAPMRRSRTVAPERGPGRRGPGPRPPPRRRGCADSRRTDGPEPGTSALHRLAAAAASSATTTTPSASPAPSPTPAKSQALADLAATLAETAPGRAAALADQAASSRQRSRRRHQGQQPCCISRKPSQSPRTFQLTLTNMHAGSWPFPHQKFLVAGQSRRARQAPAHGLARCRPNDSLSRENHSLIAVMPNSPVPAMTPAPLAEQPGLGVCSNPRPCLGLKVVQLAR